MSGPDDTVRVRIEFEIPREVAAQHWPSARSDRALAAAFRRYMRENARLLVPGRVRPEHGA